MIHNEVVSHCARLAGALIVLAAAELARRSARRDAASRADSASRRSCRACDGLQAQFKQIAHGSQRPGRRRSERHARDLAPESFSLGLSRAVRAGHRRRRHAHLALRQRSRAGHRAQARRHAVGDAGDAAERRRASSPTTSTSRSIDAGWRRGVGHAWNRSATTPISSGCASASSGELAEVHAARRQARPDHDARVQQVRAQSAARSVAIHVHRAARRRRDRRCSATPPARKP